MNLLITHRWGSSNDAPTHQMMNPNSSNDEFTHQMMNLIMLGFKLITSGLLGFHQMMKKNSSNDEPYDEFSHHMMNGHSSLITGAHQMKNPNSSNDDWFTSFDELGLRNSSIEDTSFFIKWWAPRWIFSSFDELGLIKGWTMMNPNDEKIHQMMSPSDEFWTLRWAIHQMMSLNSSNDEP